MTFLSRKSVIPLKKNSYYHTDDSISDGLKVFTARPSVLVTDNI